MRPQQASAGRLMDCWRSQHLHSCSRWEAQWSDRFSDCPPSSCAISKPPRPTTARDVLDATRARDLHSLADFEIVGLGSEILQADHDLTQPIVTIDDAEAVFVEPM